MKIEKLRFIKQKIYGKKETPSKNLSIPIFGNGPGQALKSSKNKFKKVFQKVIEFFDWKPRKAMKESKIEVKEIEAETAIIKAENKEMEIIINNIKNKKED